ncbi:MAG: hypothetical protein AAF899_17945 [Pseudomonadota bacterium]
MTAVLDRAIAHFAAQGVQTIDVPEWGEEGQPLVLEFAPPSLAMVQQVRKLSKGDDTQSLLWLIVKSLRHPGGEAVFDESLATVKALESRVDPQVLARIGETIMGTGAASGGAADVNALGE